MYHARRSVKQVIFRTLRLLDGEVPALVPQCSKTLLSRDFTSSTKFERKLRHSPSKFVARQPLHQTRCFSLSDVDPFSLVAEELGSLRESVKTLLGSRHPTLDSVAKYYLTSGEGKQIRPLIVLLIAQATNGLSPVFAAHCAQDATSQDSTPLSSNSVLNISVNASMSDQNILNDVNPDLPHKHATATSAEGLVLPAQRRLAEITEMVHVASLLHDDVIDAAEFRRGRLSSPGQYGNKLSILAGDFLLARSSIALSRLGSLEVVELVSSVLANLVEGEIMQMKGNTPQVNSAASPNTTSGLTAEIFDYYMRKTYLKTASLIAKTARACTILGGCGEQQGWIEGSHINDAAYAFGKNLGIAFQLVDDCLDYTASSQALGKPSDGADLKLGLATAPVLYAWDEFPELGEMIGRKFENKGDPDRALRLVLQSSGIARTHELASTHAARARDALQSFPDSQAREALVNLTYKVLTRQR